MRNPNPSLKERTDTEPIIKPEMPSLNGRVDDRRHTLAKTGAIAGGIYLAGRYVADRLEEVRDKVMQERMAREQ